MTERIEVTDDVGRDLSADSTQVPLALPHRCGISCARSRTKSSTSRKGGSARGGGRRSGAGRDLHRGCRRRPARPRASAIAGDRVVLHVDALEALQREKRRVCQIQPPCDRNPSAPRPSVQTVGMSAVSESLRQHSNEAERRGAVHARNSNRLPGPDRSRAGGRSRRGPGERSSRDDKQLFPMTAGIDDRAVLSS